MPERKYDRRHRKPADHAIDLTKYLTVIGTVLGVLMGLQTLGVRLPFVGQRQAADEHKILEERLHQAIVEAENRLMLQIHNGGGNERAPE